MRNLCFLFLFLLGAGRGFCQDALSNLLNAARQFEIRPLEQKPSWAEAESPPLFTVAWLSDLHITDQTSENLVRTACLQVSNELKPDLTFITGDNCGLPEKLLPPASGKSLGWRRHQWLYDFLRDSLAGDYVIIPGDNWPWDFEQVFGVDKRSFTLGGFHFIFVTPDQQAISKEGCVTFDEGTLAWLEKQIQQNSNKPTLLLMHEPIWPPAFLDAPKIRSLVDANQQIIGVLGGHLHLDLEFSSKHWKQWCCPAIGRSHNPAFKRISFYREKILLTSYEWSQEKSAFVLAAKWQQIIVPKSLRADLPNQAPEGGFAIENQQVMPPRARQKNPQLAERFAELSALNMSFMLEVVFGGMLQK